jgi:hypothetical protein
LLDRTLFPKNEDWASGDEACDAQLTKALNHCFENLTQENILKFYKIGLSQKLRISNKYYESTITMVVKALLFLQSEKENKAEYIDEKLTKFHGQFDQKKIVPLESHELAELFKLCLRGEIVRYKDQLDFHLFQDVSDDFKGERNPYLRVLMPRSGWVLRVKIKWKECKTFFSTGSISQNESLFLSDPLLKALSQKDQVTLVNNWAYLWYNDQEEIIYSLLHPEIREQLNDKTRIKS